LFMDFYWCIVKSSGCQNTCVIYPYVNLSRELDGISCEVFNGLLICYVGCNRQYFGTECLAFFCKLKQNCSSSCCQNYCRFFGGESQSRRSTHTARCSGYNDSFIR